MKIKIYAIGKIKEDYLKIGIGEYIKKIKLIRLDIQGQCRIEKS